MGAGLLQPQRKPAEFPRQFTGKRDIVPALVSVNVRSVEQELCGRVLIERGKFELSHTCGKIRGPRGDDDMAAFETRHEFRHLGDGGAIVDVVEDHQPCRVGLKPAEGGRDLGRVIARLLLWQVKNLESR